MPQSRADSPSPEEQPKRLIDSPVGPSKPQKIARVVSGDQQPESLEPEARKMGSQRYLVALEYIGTKFSGSQKQPNCRTVEGVLEDAFLKFIGQSVSISFSSRTDVGVHALSNTFHVDVERISKRKPGEVLPPHEPGVVRRAVNHFLQAKSPVKTLDELHVCEVIPSSSFPSITGNERKDGLIGERKIHRLYMITARARSFLYHQVRLLVGLLKSVGTGDLNTDDVERILNARTVTEAPPMAPACGLYLGNVMYHFSSDDDQNN